MKNNQILLAAKILMKIDVDRTLSRIRYTGPRNVSVGVLDALQQAFLLNVPFENLDIHQGREIRLEPDVVERKIVEERRGGFCYESNGLFHRLLEALGFRVRMCSAQMMQDRGLSPLYDHMVLVAEVDGHEYLVDVANGESVRTPLRLDSKEISKSPEGKTYRLGEFYGIPALEVQESNEQEWRPRFVFIPAACRLEEFADRCHFHQTSKKSQFTRQPLVTLALPEGRVTLAGRTLTVTHARSSVTARELNTDAEYKACLHAQFGIHL